MDYHWLGAEVRRCSRAFELDSLQKAVVSLLRLIAAGDENVNKDLRNLLADLRNERRYLQIVQIAEASVKAGFQDPRVQTIYAQAMIELGRHVPALGILNLIKGEVEKSTDTSEMPEILGITGRAWKDIAYEALIGGDGTPSEARRMIATKALKASLANYYSGLKFSGSDVDSLCWFAVNLVGLSALAERFNINLPTTWPIDYAKEVIAKMNEAFARGRTPEAWDLASLCELYAATQDFDSAETYAYTFLKHPDIDCFKLASTERQLNQIWNIRASARGCELHNCILNGLLTNQGGFVLDSRQLASNRGPLQLNIGGRAAVPLTELKNAMKVAKSVAMIRVNFDPIGTGFVVRASDLGLDATLDRVVVTNAHVVSDPPQDKAVHPDEAQITFQAFLDTPTFNIKRIVRCLEMKRHDCCILELTEPLPPDAPGLDLYGPELRSDTMERAYVIGHPAGQELSFSLFDSELLGFDRPAGHSPQRVHYRSPTFYGSSGSPVFNRNWKVIALHRAGYESISRLDGLPGTYAANEGISIHSIRAALRNADTGRRRRSRKSA